MSDYPPTLTEKHLLEQRLDKIEQIAPDFFKGKNFLDIGCNNAWFMKNYNKNFRFVMGIDPGQYDMIKGTYGFQNIGFRKYISHRQYDTNMDR